MDTIQRPVPARRDAAMPPFPIAPPSLVEYGSRRLFVVAGVMLAALLQTVDATIVNVALPTIQGNLGATVDEGTWVVTAYVIANVVVIPLTPWLQVRFGRKNYFLASIAGFTIASMLCGLATSLPMLIAFRVVQGAFGGGLLATAQLILRDTFPPEQLGTSQSIFALGAILGPSVGPTLGGIITDNISWQWIFDVNVAPGVLAFIILAMYLRDNAAPKRAPVDGIGVGLLIVAIGSLQYVLDQGQHDDWFSNETIAVCAVTTIAGFAGFVWWELRNPTPIVDLRLLRRIPVAAASLIGMTNAVNLFAVLLLLPQFTVDQLGFTSTDAGLLLGMRALPIALLTVPVGRLANLQRLDLRYLIGGGLTVAGISSLILAGRLTTGSDITSFILPLSVAGIGIGFTYSPLLVATLRAVHGADAPKAASFVTLATQLSGSISSAVMVTIVDRREQWHQTMLVSEVTRANPAVDTFVANHPMQQLYQTIVSQAAALSYADAFLICGVVAVLLCPLVILLGRNRAQISHHHVVVAE